MPKTFKPDINYVEPLGRVGVARKLTAGDPSTSVTLSTGVYRISMRAVGADIRYVIGQGAQTAGSSSHFIANGERLDISVQSGDTIAAFRNAGTNGTLEITELN